jgi:glycyl-tRNA synthetase
LRLSVFNPEHQGISMSFALYDDLAGLRFWRQTELNLRRRIRDAILDTVQATLNDINQMWVFEEVETPPMMPLGRMSAAYDRSDIFVLQDPPGGERPYALRAETTDGTYAIAAHIMRTTKLKPPLCLWQMGYSHRRETSDGATAAKLRLNAFTQLELQLIYAEDTKAEIATPLRDALAPVVARTTGLETRLVASDRLPPYATETIDIECLLPNGEWREVASTSRRTDFPSVPGFKPCRVFEIAFGMDRMVALTNGAL